MTAILSRLGLSLLTGKWWAVIGLLCAAVGAGGAWIGYRWADANWTVRHAAAQQDFNRALFDLDQSVRAREKAAIERATKRQEVVSRAQKDVGTMVTPDGCRLTDGGLQELVLQGRRAFTGSEPVGDR